MKIGCIVIKCTGQLHIYIIKYGSGIDLELNSQNSASLSSYRKFHSMNFERIGNIAQLWTTHSTIYMINSK